MSEIAYIFSEESTGWFNKLPSNLGRSQMIHSLIKALGLFNFISTIKPDPDLNSLKFLENYHSRGYLNLIFNNRETSSDELESFGLVDDCSIFPELSNYVFFLSGAIEATLKALDHGFRYVINWDGGRHHAQASLASGFCYINDVVLLILSLEEHYDRILYIDLDLHHGDGVEKAFIFSDKVFTFSMHKHSAGFFPGTGNFDEKGKGRGYGYCLNFPIAHKISGKNFYNVFNSVFKNLLVKFDPDIIVCVCGADILSTDPHAAFNVGSQAYSKCISEITETKIPTVFLGGGGYNHSSTAKCWSILTHQIISCCYDISRLPEVVPEHEFWPQYAHDDILEVLENQNQDTILGEDNNNITSMLIDVKKRLC